jgi:hypothetical protein
LLKLFYLCHVVRANGHGLAVVRGRV